MTDITVTAAQVAPVFSRFGKAEIYDAIASVTITAGQAVYIVAASGQLALADATTGGAQLLQYRGIALNGGGAGQAISFIMHGAVYGFTLSGMNYDAIVYLSNNAGNLADTTDGDVNIECGRVMAMSDADATRVLFVDVDMAAADYS